MIWTWDERGEFKGQPVMLWRAYAEVLARGIELWLDGNADKWCWWDEFKREHSKPR